MYKQGFYNLALDYIEKAIQHGDSSSQEVWEHLGDVLLKIGNTDRAIESWQKAAELEGSNTEAIKKKIEENEE
jgi:tetratricopeptide (TPR) repeat protein